MTKEEIERHKLTLSKLWTACREDANLSSALDFAVEQIKLNEEALRKKCRNCLHFHQGWFCSHFHVKSQSEGFCHAFEEDVLPF